MDVLGYSSHDWRKNTDDAVVMDSWGGAMLRVNDSKVRFTHLKLLKQKKLIYQD